MYVTPRSFIHSLKTRMTSHPCNKYEQITLPYLLSVNYYMVNKHTVEDKRVSLVVASVPIKRLQVCGRIARPNEKKSENYNLF